MINIWDGPEKYKLIFDMSPDAIVILDKDGKFVEANGRLFEWLNYARNEVIGKTLLNIPIFSISSKAIVLKNFAARILGKKISPYELEFIAKDGKVIIGEIRATPIKDENGKIIGDLVMATDITDRKNAQKELEEKTKDLEKLNALMIDREIKMVELKEKLERNGNKP